MSTTGSKAVIMAVGAKSADGVRALTSSITWGAHLAEHPRPVRQRPCPKR